MQSFFKYFKNLRSVYADHITSNFRKTVFHKLDLIHSWNHWPKYASECRTALLQSVSIYRTHLGSYFWIYLLSSNSVRSVPFSQLIGIFLNIDKSCGKNIPEKINKIISYNIGAHNFLIRRFEILSNQISLKIHAFF